MLCPVCNVKRFLYPDIDSIENDGYCTTCARMDKYFEADNSMTEKQAIDEGLTIVDGEWFGQQGEPNDTNV